MEQILFAKDICRQYDLTETYNGLTTKDGLKKKKKEVANEVFRMFDDHNMLLSRKPLFVGYLFITRVI